LKLETAGAGTDARLDSKCSQQRSHQGSDNRATGYRRTGGRIRLLAFLAAALVAGFVGTLAVRSAPARRDVLIVTIDTLRADAAGRGKGLPALEAFLARSTHFAKARTTVPLTVPAHTSLFSGLRPRDAGVHDNVASPLPPGRKYTLLAEEFSRAGYETAGFAASTVMGPQTGLGSGFDHYDAPELRTADQTEEADYGDLPAEASVERALRWLERRSASQPFFAWVHFYDPHDPYLPYAGDDARPGTSEYDTDAARYAGEVRRVDAALERLLAAVPPETIVVICSDHGEALGEHGEKTHGALCFSCTSDIFLAVRAPGLPEGAVDGDPRSICDIAPTLRAWCGLPARRSDGSPLFEKSARPVLTESLYYYRLHGWGQTFSVSDGRNTLVESGAALELYDRSKDPAEVSALDPRGSRDYEALDRLLHAYRSGAAGGGEPGAIETAPATPYGSLRRPTNRYLPREENAKLPDPRTKFDFVDRLDQRRMRALRASRRGDPWEMQGAIDSLEALVREDSYTAVPLYDLVYALGKMGELSGDRRYHRRAAAAAREVVARGYLVPPPVFEACGQALLSGVTEDLLLAVATAEKAAGAVDRGVAGILRRVVAELQSRGETAAAARGQALISHSSRAP